ncbi:MAG TPA: hypothetical protein VF941_02280, partial [Clostridia bacterium]
KQPGREYQLIFSSWLFSYILYTMHFDALFVLAGLATFFALSPDLDAFEGDAFDSDLLLQFLLVHWPLITIEPHVQNSAKYITPLYYKYITK